MLGPFDTVIHGPADDTYVSLSNVTGSLNRRLITPSAKIKFKSPALLLTLASLCQTFFYFLVKRQNGRAEKRGECVTGTTNLDLTAVAGSFTVQVSPNHHHHLLDFLARPSTTFRALPHVPRTNLSATDSSTFFIFFVGRFFFFLLFIFFKVSPDNFGEISERRRKRKDAAAAGLLACAVFIVYFWVCA